MSAFKTLAFSIYFIETSYLGNLESDKFNLFSFFSGAGESGKSTFLKQMKIIHGVVFEPEQLKEFRRIIYQNMIKAMRVLVDANRKLKIPLRDPANRLAGDQVGLIGLNAFHSKPVFISSN